MYRSSQRNGIQGVGFNSEFINHQNKGAKVQRTESAN